MKRSLRAVLGLLCGAFLHSAAASEQLPGGTALNLKDQHHALLSKRASLTNEVSVTCAIQPHLGESESATDVRACRWTIS